MPPKIIGRKACLQTKSLFKLSKDPGLKRHQTFEGRMNQKNKKIYENGGGKCES
jgi:hypothetical protein